MSSLSMSSNLYIDNTNKEINIFAKDDDMLDCKIIHNELGKRYNINIDEYRINLYFNEYLLTGSKETPNNPLFFGELDKEGVFRESKPVYHLQASDEIIESTSNNRDSTNTDSNNSLSTLQIFLNGNTLTLLNYSLLDSSLNIKLECSSSESKAIQEREKEQAQRDSSPMAQNDRESKAKDSLKVA